MNEGSDNNTKDVPVQPEVPNQPEVLAQAPVPVVDSAAEVLSSATKRNLNSLGVSVGDSVILNYDYASNSASAEAKETPSLRLTVDRSCNNPEGLYVSLSAVQRKGLGVSVGDSVILRNTSNGEVVGIYTVGLGLKDLKDKPESFAANGVVPGTEVVVERSSVEHAILSLPLNIGVETDARHEKRLAKISDGRFDGAEGFADPEAYLVLPTAIAKLFITPPKGVTPAKDTVPAISLGKIKLGDKVFTMPVVPSGTEFGMTTKAASKLGVPEGNLSNVQYYLNNEGVLVINQIN